MPKTVQLRPALIDTLLTNERMASYQAVFHPGSDLELMGAYLWNSQVCSALYPLVSAAEVALRNSIDQALRVELGMFWWTRGVLKHKSHSRGGPPPHPVRIVTDNLAKSYSAARRIVVKTTGNKNAKPTHGGVVAGADFSTWENLLDNEYMGRGLIWPKVLGDVFKGQWHQGPGQTLRYARETTKTVREFRNRLSHHEPAWKRYGVTTEMDAVQHLQEKIDRVAGLLALIHPEKVKLLERNGFLPTARRVCSISELRRYQLSHARGRVGTMRKLHALIGAAHDEDRAIEVTTFSGTARRFLMTPLPT